MSAIADKMEIRELLFKYALMADKGLWDMQDSIFSANATIDYTSVGKGGTLGPSREMLSWLRDALKHSSIRYHVISNEIIEVDGDKATCTCIFSSPMDLNEPGQPAVMMTNTGYYHDKLVRTPQGWRIFERVCSMGLQLFHKDFAVV